jgi:ribonuclease-3
VIYKKFPKSQEGELSKFRSALVNRSALADCARKLDLGNFLFLGEGEQRTIAIQRNSTMSDVFESVIGAVFLDGGYLAVTKVVKRIFRGSICEDVMAAHHANYKGGLQELSQKTFGLIPHYSLVKEDGGFTRAERNLDNSPS